MSAEGVSKSSNDGMSASSVAAVARGAAARGSQLEAAALSRVVQPRRLFFDTAPGLEPMLQRELQALGILRGRAERYHGGLYIEAPESLLWRAALQSRLLLGGRLGVGELFHAGYESTLANYVAGVPWPDYMWFGAEPAKPPLKVHTENSRLYHTDVIERAVLNGIERRRQFFMNLRLQRNEDEIFYGRQDKERPRPDLPTLHVDLKRNECDLSVATTAVPQLRAYSLAVEEKDEHQEGRGSAWTLGDSHAAACVLKSQCLELLEECGKAERHLCVWDPFCGRGKLLLEALGLALGVPPASPVMQMPFQEFPNFDQARFREVVRSLELSPSPHISKLVLVGSHADADVIHLANRNLQAFARALPRPRSGPASLIWPLPSGDVAEKEDPMSISKRRLPCSVTFQHKDPESMLETLRGHPTMILTNVPYGNKADAKKDRRLYARFGKMLKAEQAHGYLKGIYCLSAREDFKRFSGLDWRTELRFECSGVQVELLRWTGRRAPSIPRVEREKVPKQVPTETHEEVSTANPASSTTALGRKSKRRMAASTSHGAVAMPPAKAKRTRDEHQKENRYAHDLHVEMLRAESLPALRGKYMHDNPFLGTGQALGFKFHASIARSYEEPQMTMACAIPRHSANRPRTRVASATSRLLRGVLTASKWSSTKLATSPEFKLFNKI
ncbi:unnamed protein product [Symbiodinium sp. KB8]|nr:unnamed protein product [Symbiodinium sp. KB8]